MSPQAGTKVEVTGGGCPLTTDQWPTTAAAEDCALQFIHHTRDETPRSAMDSIYFRASAATLSVIYWCVLRDGGALREERIQRWTALVSLPRLAAHDLKRVMSNHETWALRAQTGYFGS